MSRRRRGSTWRTVVLECNINIKSGIRYGVVTHVEIGDRPAWVDGASHHFHELICCNSVPHPREEQRREGLEESIYEKKNPIEVLKLLLTVMKPPNNRATM